MPVAVAPALALWECQVDAMLKTLDPWSLEA
jgi:hypothetical protein